MRTELIATLFIIGVCSSCSVQSRGFPLQPRVFDRVPLHAGHSNPTGTADQLSGDSLATEIGHGEVPAAIYPRTDVHGPDDVIDPGVEERALRGAAVAAVTEFFLCSDAGYSHGLRVPLLDAGFGAAIGAGVGAVSDPISLREWAREGVCLRDWKK